MRRLLPILLLWANATLADLTQTADQLIPDVLDDVVDWRRDIHQHPELGNREFRTAALVAEHLQGLGLEVTMEVAHTGVVGVLRGSKPGPVVALRADMDALPVTEKVDLPFASKATATYQDREVGVMHACGHDNHVAILMGAAEVLSKMREHIPGTIKFIFQPAEEGAPPGEEGGADLVVAEGVVEDVDAIFALHVSPTPLGSIAYRSGQVMASADRFEIVVEGRQTHAAVPWGGVDPIMASSQILMGLQTIVSRQLDATLTPSIISVGRIAGGVRNNIIPDKVEMEGTIRTFDEAVREQIHRRIDKTAKAVAESSGASAQVHIHKDTPVTNNDPRLTELIAPTLERVATGGTFEAPRVTNAEDFSYYQAVIPGVIFFLGVSDPEDANPAQNHSPYFYADERALPVGVRAMTHVALDFLSKSATSR